MIKKLILIIVTVIPFVFLSQDIFGWSMGHCRITKGALETLPEWQREFIGDEQEKLIWRYSLYPDWYSGKTRKEVEPYIMPEMKKSGMFMDVQPLHFDAPSALNQKMFNYYIGNILTLLSKEETKSDGIKFLGTFLHVIEDRGCPAHSVPEDLQFNELRQFLPPPEGSRFSKPGPGLHSAMEDLNVEYKKAPEYRPKLMGTNKQEVIWALDKRLVEIKSYANSQVIPIIKQVYKGDKKKSRELQLQVAYKNTELVADLIYTMISLATKQHENRQEFVKASQNAQKCKGKGKIDRNLDDVIDEYRKLFNWKSAYKNIVKASLETIPENQRKTIKNQIADLISKYSIYPDRKDFLKIPTGQISKAGLDYNGASFHMPVDPVSDKNIFKDYISTTIKWLKNGEIKKGCETLGVLAHCVIDRNTPANLYNRNFYCSRFKHFLPAPEGKKEIWETGSFFDYSDPVSISGYTPELLGETPNEVAFRLLAKLRNQSLANARHNFIPLIEAHYNSDIKKITFYQQSCAERAAKDVADLIYSILILSSKIEIDKNSQTKLKQISLLEIPELNIYNQQRRWTQNLAYHHWNWHWHLPNYVGRLWRNSSGGWRQKKNIPLKLSLNGTAKEYPVGFSQGPDYGHSFLIPSNVFSRFKAVIGPQIDMGGNSEFCFMVKLDNKEAYKSKSFKKGSEAQEINLDISDAEKLSLHVKKLNGKTHDIHAVWAEPILTK